MTLRTRTPVNDCERESVMCSTELSWKSVSCFLLAAFLSSGSVAESSEQELLTAAGKPAEGPLDVFLGEPLFDVQVVFDEGDNHSI